MAKKAFLYMLLGYGSIINQASLFSLPVLAFNS